MNWSFRTSTLLMFWWKSNRLCLFAFARFRDGPRRKQLSVLVSRVCLAFQPQEEVGDWWEKDMWVFPKIGVPQNHQFYLIGFSLINHPFWGTTIFGNTHVGITNLQSSFVSQTFELWSLKKPEHTDHISQESSDSHLFAWQNHCCWKRQHISNTKKPSWNWYKDIPWCHIQCHQPGLWRLQWWASWAFHMSWSSSNQGWRRNHSTQRR